jgi:pyruvate dehydrogenase E1 component
VISVTSWSELARDGLHCEQVSVRAEPVEAHANPSTSSGRTGYIGALLASSQAPIVAATDYVRAVPESVRAFLPEGRPYLTLGTDGFGRSDTRAALREFFGVDAAHIVKAAHHALSRAVNMR